MLLHVAPQFFVATEGLGAAFGAANAGCVGGWWDWSSQNCWRRSGLKCWNGLEGRNRLGPVRGRHDWLIIAVTVARGVWPKQLWGKSQIISNIYTVQRGVVEASVGVQSSTRCLFWVVQVVLDECVQCGRDDS